MSLAFQMRPQPGCSECDGYGLVSRRGGPGRYVGRETEPCPCRQPTAILTVRGTAEAREGLPRLRGDWKKCLPECQCERGFTGPDESERTRSTHRAGPFRLITRRLLKWTGEEPLDLLELAEVYVEGCDCLGGHDPRECGGLASYSIPGVDGLIVPDDYGHCFEEREWERQALRMGLEVEYD